MSKQLSQVVVSRMNMQPALISPSHGTLIADSLRQLATADADHEEKEQIKARNNMLAAYGYGPSNHEKIFVYADGIAFIPISGLLINRFNSSYGWVTGYNFIRSWLEAAVEDEDVKLIVFDCNSCGGEVAGCFELAADIYASRDKKPSVAIVDACSYSACYALASAASKIIVTPSGGVGSIGVVAMHVDFSKMLDDFGIKVTFIYSGDHKVDGNPFEPLPEPVRKSIQSRVDSTRQEFVTLVASNRGLDAKVVFDTQAACYTADEALDLGLIDDVAPPQSAVRAFFAELSDSETQKESTMSTSAAKPGAESAAAAIPENDTAAAAATTAAPAATQTVDAAAVQTAERERIKAITTHEAAKDKQTLASHLALDTQMSVEDAVKTLAAAAPETKAAEPAKSEFAAAMDTSEHPNVGAGAGAGAQGEQLSAAQSILRSQQIATGAKAN